MICEHCKNSHDGSYGSGRFCSPRCARSFSTSKNRDEINKKVSQSLKGYRTIPGGKIKLCDYGCGRSALHQFKNGKWCCSNNINSCPGLKQKNSKRLKILHKNKFSKKYCLFCGKLILPIKTYCSNKCHNDYVYNYYIEKWLKREISGTVKGGASSYIRRYLRETYANKCSLCGWCKTNPVTNNVPIELDHIDGNHKNNDPENVRLLCPNCHSLTSTYKALNTGNGRKYRRTKKDLPVAKLDVATDF